MKFQVLGCSGSGLPGYALTSFRINDSVLLDAGAVTSHLPLEEQAQITDVLVTHAHLDHIKDILFLADNLIELVVRDEHGPVRVRGLEDVLNSIRTHLMNDTIWPDFSILPDRKRPVIVYTPMRPGEEVEIGDLLATAFPVCHAKAAAGYVVREKGAESGFAFTGDTGPTDAWWKFLNGLEYRPGRLIIETSFPNEMEDLALKSNHLTPRLLQKELAKLEFIPKIYISHMKSPFSSAIQEELQTHLDGYNYHLLRDDEVFEF
ncbi:MAG: 3',5'-cyclic-nucleotide phosphodiesterase [Deltaproteobacteria bacterium]|nr:3',5'-cyclic-nucleotide phosphodiesterase [Deltaproteobacteria bacterium]